MLYILIAILAGVSIVIARIINANLAKKVGVFEGTFFNYVIGLLFSFIFLLFSKELLQLSKINFSIIPWWAYLGGVIGVIVVVLSNYITPRISSFYLTLLIFVGQFFVGMMIDYIALNLLSIGKIVGGLLVLIGLIYNLLLDKDLKNQEVRS